MDEVHTARVDLDTTELDVIDTARRQGLTWTDVATSWPSPATSSPALEAFWAVLRSGVDVTAVNHHLATDEVVHIVDDSGARAIGVSADKGKHELKDRYVNAERGEES